MKNKNEGEEYINAFPKLRKWINECLCCHEKVYNIKRLFKPLLLNQDGLCLQCEKVLRNRK